MCFICSAIYFIIRNKYIPARDAIVQKLNADIITMKRVKILKLLPCFCQNDHFPIPIPI